MASITDDDDHIQNSLEALEAAVDKVRKTDDITARRKEEKTARSELNKVKSEATSFRNAVQKLEDPTQRSVFNRKYNKYDSQLKEYDKELRNLVTAPKKGSAAASNGKGGNAPKGKNANRTYEDDSMDKIMGEGGADGLGFESAKQVMQAANRAQDDINKSLKRSLKLGHTMRDQTHEILETLAKQTEKLHQVDKELMELDGEVDRAKHEVQWFFRQMAKDKCCLALMVFLLLGVCGLIFWRLYSNRFPDAPGALPTTTTTTLEPGPSTAPPLCVSFLCDG